ncbi:LPXTG cell wall anchor domain-containing protein [Streptomyces sp. cmx-18-6]|uniref:LPXTG cell wall anchor domain-containing protein n=1 Tax=Streptomyces sp. cmx-18-6 TaxID=2790930 RepID=UPI0039817746
MKIRRALAVAAATAVLAPITLLSASVAVADPGAPATEATETAETSPAPEDTDVPSEDEESKTPADEEPKTPPADEKSEEGEEDKKDEEGKKDEEPSAAEKPQSPPATSPTPTPPATAPGDICEGVEELKVDENLRTSLSGLPSKIVAGSGFHGFKLNVVNKGDNAYKRVDLGVFAAQIDADTWEDTSGHLTLQFKNPETGVWTDILLGDDEEAGYLGYTDVRAKESFSIDLRLSVDKKAPAGFGFALTVGLYADDEGNCVFADSARFYEFDVLAADAEPGKPNEAEPQEGGKKPVPVKPVGNSQVKPEGNLAQTGSDSNLPVIATIGGVAIVAGAGVVFALGRRRRSSGVAA